MVVRCVCELSEMSTRAKERKRHGRRAFAVVCRTAICLIFRLSHTLVYGFTAAGPAPLRMPLRDLRPLRPCVSPTRDSSADGSAPGKIHEISATSPQDVRRVSASLGRATSWLRAMHSGSGQDAWQAAP